MTKMQMKTMLLAVLGFLALLPGARADEWNQKTIFTFSGPVEIPGQVLPAGTYVFKLADSSSNRHIVQVFNEDQNHLFGMFLAIPDYQLRPSDKPIIKFHERPAGSPDAVKAWFYPGQNYGHEFVYPKAKALALAEANHTPVPSIQPELMPDTTTLSTASNAPEIAVLNTAPLKAEEPNGDEVELAEAFVVTETQAAAPSAAPETLPEELPATATSLPLIGLMGLLSLGTAVTLRIAAVKAKASRLG